MAQSKIWTQALTGAFTVTEDMLLTVLSLQVASGTCQVQGDLNLPGYPSQTVTLAEGSVLVIPATGPNAPLGGITITPSGTTNVVGTQ